MVSELKSLLTYIDRIQKECVVDISVVTDATGNVTILCKDGYDFISTNIFECHLSNKDMMDTAYPNMVIKYYIQKAVKEITKVRILYFNSMKKLKENNDE